MVSSRQTTADKASIRTERCGVSRQDDDPEHSPESGWGRSREMLGTCFLVAGRVVTSVNYRAWGSGRVNDKLVVKRRQSAREGGKV